MVLAFVGVKLLLIDVYKVPSSGVSLGVVLGAASLASWLRARLLAAEGRRRVARPHVIAAEGLHA